MERDIRITDKFELGFSDPSRDPLVVVKQTKTALDLRFNDLISDNSFVNDYLGSYTLPFLSEARTFTPEITGAASSRVENVSSEDLVRRKTSYDISRIIVGLIPAYFSQQVAEGDSLGLLRLARPFTAEETDQQIDEMVAVLNATIKTNAAAKDNGIPSSAIVRTLAFFQVGANLPLERPQNKKSIQQASRYKYGRLLEGIDLRLNEELEREEHFRYVNEIWDLKSVRAQDQLQQAKADFNTLLEGIEIDI